MSPSLYVIVDGDPTAEQFNASTTPLIEVGGALVSMARRSVDNMKTVLEFDEPIPPCFDAMVIYSHAAIVPIMQGPDWTPEEPSP